MNDYCDDNCGCRWDVRYHCPQCGRFVPESRVHSEDRIDPNAYYGVDTNMWVDCPRCGRIDTDMPHIPFRTRKAHHD